MRQEGFELLGVVEGRRENRLQRASVELRGGALFQVVKRPRCRTQKGTPYGVGVHEFNVDHAQRRRKVLSCLGVLFFTGGEA